MNIENIKNYTPSQLNKKITYISYLVKDIQHFLNRNFSFALCLSAVGSREAKWNVKKVIPQKGAEKSRSAG